MRHQVLDAGRPIVRLLAALLVFGLLGICGTASAAIGYRQSNWSAPASGATVNVTYTSAQLAGSLNVVAVGWSNGTSHITSVTDSRGNLYELASGPTNWTNGSFVVSQAIYYATNITAANAGANVVTVHFDSSAFYPDVRIAEYTGVATTNPVDGSVEGSGTSTAVSSGVLITTNANDLLVAANVVETGTTATGPGFTRRMLTQPDGDILMDRVVTAAGSYTATATIAPAGAWVMQLVAFRAAPAGGDTTPPSVPTGLTATPQSSSQVNLGWTASTDNVAVTSYGVERCTGSGCTNFTQIATPATTTFNDTGRAGSTTYRYRVRALDAAGNASGYSTIVDAVTPAAADTTAPSAPTGLVAAPASTTQINLSWTASTDNVGVTGYSVERCTGASCTTFAQVGTPTSPGFNDSGLAASTTYRYRVRATDAAGNLSAYSTIVNGTTPAVPDTTPPTAPSSLAATAVSSSQINLSWGASTDNVGVTQYQIERCSGAACSTFVQIATATGTTFNNTGLLANTSYSYRVRATDAATNLSGYSNTASATTQAVQAGAPPIASYSFDEGTGTTVTDISGNANTGTINGTINASTWTTQGKNGGALVFNGTNNRVSVADAPSLDLTTAVTLEAWVYPTADQSGWRAIIQKETDAWLLHASNSAGNLRPAAGATIGGTGTFFSAPNAIPVNAWTFLSQTYDGTTIRLYVNGTQVATAARTGALQVTASPMWIGGNNPYGEFFQGRIDDVRVYNRALSAAEITNDMNTPVGTPPPPDTQAPTAPGSLNATAFSSSQVNLTWTASTDDVGVTQYSIERCTGVSCTSFAQIATATGTSTSYNNTGLVQNTTYNYRVRATDAAGNLSAYSDVASATTPALPPDTTPPTISITSPTTGATYSTSLTPMTLGGVSSDNVGVAQVTWANDRGGSGTATGTTSWSVSGVALQTGQNVITVTATDGSGNAASATLTVTYSQPTGGSGLVAAYTFDEGSGNTLGDSSGFSNHGTISGASWTTQGKYGGALTFNGSNNRVNVPSSTSLNITGAITLEAWVFPTANQSGWRDIMQKETDAWLLHASNNTGDLRPAAGGTYAGTVGLISAPSAIPTSVWTHLAQTYDGTTLRLYVNGTQVASAPHAGALQVTASPLSIGGSLAYGEFFQGRIDDARVYNRALSPAEIQADMTTPIGGGSGDSQPPTAPASLAATPASATQINLSWGASTDNVGVTQYLVERCQGAGCSSFAVIATPTTTNYGDTGLTGATSYSYRVRARDAAANLSPYSNIATASTTSDVNPPTVTITSPGGSAQLTGNATLTATAIDNESGVGGVQFQVDGVNVGPMITTPPYTTTFNTALLANGAHAIGAYAWDGSRNIGNAPVVNVTFSNGAPGNPAQTGLWTGPFTFPLVTVHSNLMPNGKALFHDGQFRGNDARVWDPVTGVFTSVTSADNIFCTGDATLADGRLLITGGHVSDDVGLPDTNYFNPTTQTWTPGPAMAFQRWYPTATTLPDGRVFIISGESTCAGCLVDVPEILNPVTNTVTQLNSSRWTVPYYPHVFVLTDGRLFVSSTSQAAIGSRTFDLNTLAWTDVDPSVKDGGSAVMYLPNKILKTGTATLPLTTTDPAAKTAYVIDMNAPNPTWRTVQSMAFARAFHTLTSLPDGTVLVTGGGRTVNREDQSTAVKQAELWDPNSETWTTLASEQVGRLYHSTAVLMQDGRVLISGGGRFSDSPQPSDMENAEWFAPPYLFKGPRPVITSAPTTLSYGAQFTVQTPDAARIAKVSLVRLANVTHTINMGQRFLPLTFTQGAGSLTVTAPPNANYATPGYYMLFIVDTNGVPSVAPIVKF